MTGPEEHRIRQEEDRLAGRPPLVIAGVAVAVVFASCVAAWGLLELWSEGERGEVRLEPMQATPRWAAPTRPGPGRGPVVADRPRGPEVPDPEAWSWVDRDGGVVRIPVDAAVEWLARAPDAMDLVRAGVPDPGPAASPDTATPQPDGAAPPSTPGTTRPAATGARPSAGPDPDPPARRDTANPTSGGAGPPALEGVEIDERPGAAVPLDAAFTEARRGPGRLGDFLAGDGPTLLVPGYYRCRMLCSYVLEGVAKGVAAMDEPPVGSDYRVVAVSIDPREEPGDAAGRRERAEAVLDGEAVARRWRFLLGSEASVQRLTRAIGFGYRYDESTDQFAHAAAIVALTPAGEVSSYLHGTAFEPDELREALEVAAAGETRTTLEQALVRCFRYLPALRRHAGLIANMLRGGGALILLAAGAVVVVAIRRARAGERA